VPSRPVSWSDILSPPIRVRVRVRAVSWSGILSPQIRVRVRVRVRAVSWSGILSPPSMFLPALHWNLSHTPGALETSSLLLSSPPPLGG